MKLHFKNSQDFTTGITAVQNILNFEISDDANITVIAKKSRDASTLSVSRKGSEAVIEYCSKVSFFRGLTLLCQNIDEDFEIKENKNFKTNGAMFDMSRNSVFRVETVKEIMKHMALMGLNTFMLYTEDTYEIEGHKYFGHMRGRYTRAEIKEMESFGESLGIELVPCIQLLGHLSTALFWPTYRTIRDTHDTLRADSEETYAFIDDMLKSLSETFKTRKIHIGMDEARFLGRGRWLDNNSYEEQHTIFYRHLGRCIEIAEKYGFRPMMWSDGFFDVDGKHGYRDDIVFTDEMKSKIPKGVDQVYWEYCQPDEETYTKMINIHKEFSENIIFAGGIWTWRGPCPAYGKTIACTVPALNACVKCGIKDVFATIWHNGAECPLVTSLLGLMIFAEMDYTGVYDLETIKKRFEFICSISADDILLLQTADHPENINNPNEDANPTRYLLYNDPLIGLLDYHVQDAGVDFYSVYDKLQGHYEKLEKKEGIFFEAFEYYRALFPVLKQKSDFGVKLKEAYDKKDFKALENLYNESFEIQKNIHNLHAVHRKSWLYYNKALGFEIFDMIYGALESRFDTLRYHLDNLKSDPGYIIGELEEERLPFTNSDEKLPPVSQRFTKLYSSNVATTVFCDIFIG